MVTSPNPDHAPALSVVLPVLNEARDIGRLLGEIMEQTTPAGGFEVLVVDGGSTDDTRDIVADFCNRLPNCRLLDNPRKRSGAGRNVGIRAARGKYILFLDGHCALPRSDYFVRTVELFDSTKAACLCRPQPLNRLTEGEWAKAISAARHSLLGHNPASDIYGGWPAFTDPSSAGAAYLRTCIESLGGYDERFDACEDVEFNCRVAAADLPAYRHPDLTVQYRPRSTPGELFSQMIRYGRGRARLMAKHPEVIPWPLIPLAVFPLIVLVVLAISGVEAAGWVAAIPMACWILMAGGESMRLAGFTAGAARIALAFLLIHLGLALGFWRGLLEFRRFRSAVSGHAPTGE